MRFSWAGHDRELGHHAARQSMTTWLDFCLFVCEVALAASSPQRCSLLFNLMFVLTAPQHFSNFEPRSLALAHAGLLEA